MSFSLLGELNWLAVVVAAIAYIALGGLRFMPRLLGDAWTKSIGRDPGNVNAPGVSLYIGPLVTCFITTVAGAMLATGVEATSFGDDVVRRSAHSLSLQTRDPIFALRIPYLWRLAHAIVCCPARRTRAFRSCGTIAFQG